MQGDLLDIGGEFSRFRTNPPILVDGVVTYGRWRQPSWLRSRPSADLIHKFAVTNDLEGRPDRIAEQLYGSPFLDWVLISFNQVRQPFGWPRTGTVLEYPDDSVVFPEL